ncbi:hypothetical protein SYNPS1DRAFT_12001 [Syncephalis pseudoplumigaleata]|uniref:K Homology domain-containing protein n=1 Tax=Syncephalis pseudoplumigaleata TaxID=1712513 RepID=A0A4P9Z5I3_9FUNG|nr:hypothetical protein SYNPS1DRAFT_12001 [Syncephalis pseudoplumigaleata]|eukprot:RKP27894.1 hypothetical protein SYNPS1DRAFT_12001 [Syncephalis pseudoplumigaleata]
MSDFLTIRPGTSLHADDSVGDNLTESVGGDSEHDGGIDSNDPIYVPSVDGRDPTAVVGSTPTSLAGTVAASKVAPDLDSPDAFPALSASTPPSGNPGAAWGAAQPAAPSMNSVFSWGAVGPAQSKPEKKQKGPSGAFPLAASRAARTSPSMEMLELPAAQVKASGRAIGEVLREVMQAFGGGSGSGQGSVEIEASTGRRSGNVTFLIRGSPADVAQARQKLVASFSPRGQLTLSIPSGTRRFVIGTGGQTLREIERTTGTKIQFPPRDADAAAEAEDDAAMVSVTIAGDIAGVKTARERIEQIISDRMSRKTISITSIEPVYFRLLAPAKHERLQQLVSDSNTRVRIPYVGARASGDEGADAATITISGKSPSVEAVEEELLAIYASLKARMRSMVVVIPKAHHRHIIGQRGATLQEIEEKTGCYVEVPAPEDDSEQVMLLGPEDKLAMALEMITEKTTSLPWNAVDLTAAVRAPSSHLLRAIRYLVHSRQLQQLEHEHHVNITLQTVPIGQPVIAEINGEAAGQIHAAKRQLVALLKQVPTDYVRVEPFEPNWRASILGAHGEHSRAILETHRVHVVLPSIFDDTPNEMLLVYQPAQSSSATASDVASAALDAATARVRALKKETADFARRTIDIPMRLYRQLTGSHDELVQWIDTECSSVSMVVDAASQGSALSARQHRGVCVMGAQHEVEQAIAKLQQHIDELARQEALHAYTVELSLPAKYEAHIIGKKGANLNRLREQYGVKLDITEAGEGEAEFTVTVQGLKKQADGAVKELREMQARLADSVVQRVKVPVKLHPALIGPQGRYVRRLEEKYQVRIQFPRGTRATSQSDGDENDEQSLAGKAGQAPDEVILSGGRKGVAEARAEMQELIEYEQARSHVAKLEVAARHLPFIMGKRGVRINELRDETNTQIDIRDHVDAADAADAADDARRATISIQGEKADVERARRRIEAIIGEQEDQCTLELDVPIEYHRQLIGAGGARIRELVQRCGGGEDAASMVRFPRPHTDDTVVVVRGQRAVAQKIYAALKAQVDEEMARHTLTMTVPAADRPTIIGQQGRTMKALESEHHVKVDLRALEEHDGVTGTEPMILVSISGEEANCERARTAIQVSR